jgi:glutathione S-transferase
MSVSTVHRVQRANECSTLADLVIFPYVAGASQTNLDLERFPELTTWHDRLVRNPHVAKGMKDVYLEV